MLATVRPATRSPRRAAPALDWAIALSHRMFTASAAPLTDLLLRLVAGSAGAGAPNRLCVEGLRCEPGEQGALAIRIARLEIAMLRVTAGPLTLQAGRVVLHDVLASVRMDAAGPRLAALGAARAELSDVALEGPVAVPGAPPAPGRARAVPPSTPAGPWSLLPLAGAEGLLEAEIVDAKLLFDAQVRVPIRQGRIDFNEATVEHVGPDSRMGISRLGLYVDAPNGRSYLYQFASPVIAGVEYERRGALPGPWGARRGSVQLQPFAEALLHQGGAGHGHGTTEQARQLFDRTAVSGHVQLGDGSFAAPGLRAELAGRAAGHNTLRLRSQAVGRGLELGLASLRLDSIQWQSGDTRLDCGAVAGDLSLELVAEGTQLRGVLLLKTASVSDLRLRRPAAPTG